MRYLVNGVSMGIFLPYFTKNWCRSGCRLALLGLSLLMAVYFHLITYHNTCFYHDNEAAQNATNDEVETQQSYSNTLRHLGGVTLLRFPSPHKVLGNALR